MKIQRTTLRQVIFFLEKIIGKDIEIKEISSGEISHTKCRLDILLGSLSNREKKIIKLRYFDNEKHTLSEIGKEMGYSGSHVRQIEQKGIRKLRHVGRMFFINKIIDEIKGEEGLIDEIKNRKKLIYKVYRNRVTICSHCGGTCYSKGDLLTVTEKPLMLGDNFIHERLDYVVYGRKIENQNEVSVFVIRK